MLPLEKPPVDIAITLMPDHESLGVLEGETRCALVYFFFDNEGVDDVHDDDNDDDHHHILVMTCCSHFPTFSHLLLLAAVFRVNHTSLEFATR